MISSEMTLARAGVIARDFERCIAPISYEDRGILFSEMLFLCAAVASEPPARIVESGRGRGQSTVVLASCFPGCHIISIDIDSQSEDAVFGERRLVGLSNVSLLVGDARVMLPDIVRSDDVVLIDGPKSYRALHMALDMLASCRPQCVFLHDFHQGLPERKLLESLSPAAFFSDDADFVDDFRYLDQPIREKLTGDAPQATERFRRLGVYGPTLACIPHDESHDYQRDAEVVAREGFMARTGIWKTMRERRVKAESTSTGPLAACPRNKPENN